jgi:aminoglycoside phosphotransferase family enzyme/predicted kinase
MREPRFYPHRPERVELRETYTSWVFLAGDLAYKVKKPVSFPFLDYGTVERRRKMCREEVRLNRRLAPTYYLGVDSIVSGRDGFCLAPGDDPRAVEYTVRMRRVSEERTLDSLATRGALTEAEVDSVANRIAGFHLAAEQAPREARELGRLVEPFEENLEMLREVGPPALGRDRLLAAERFSAAFLAARREQIAGRVNAGLVRDCHGDLRAEHVIVDGAVEIYDCIEFNPALRLIDVGADLAFLVMDLARLGQEALASRLVSSYREAGGDPGDDALLHFYAAYRAWVRAKVACLRAGELPEGGPGRDHHRDEARAMMALGHRLAWRARLPLVMVVCGVAASGKTVLASRLADVSGIPHLSSDVTRKRLAGLAPTQRAAPEHYAEEFTLRTYEELGRLAGLEIDRRGGAIVDATFLRAEPRRAFAAGLGPSRVVLFVECRAPRRMLLERSRTRAASGESASDADSGIVERQLREFEPLDEVAAESRATISTDRPIEEEVVEVEELANRFLARAAAAFNSA